MGQSPMSFRRKDTAHRHIRAFGVSGVSSLEDNVVEVFPLAGNGGTNGTRPRDRLLHQARAIAFRSR